MQVAFEVNKHNIALYVNYVMKENFERELFGNTSVWMFTFVKRLTSEFSCSKTNGHLILVRQQLGSQSQIWKQTTSDSGEVAFV